MRIHGTLVVFAIAAMSLLSSARAFGQDELPMPAEERNAALLYWQYRHMLSDSDLFSLANQDWKDDASWTPGEALSKSLGANQDAIQTLLRATSQSECDWGVEYERGPSASLPHLSMARLAARVLRADARRLASADDATGATARVVGIFGIARHLHQQDALVMERDAAVSISLGAIAEAQWLVNRGNLKAEDRARIFAELDEIVSPPDPFGFMEGVRFERDRLENNLYLEVYPGIEKKWLTPEMSEAEREAKRQHAHQVVSNVVRSLTPKVAKAMTKAAEAWTKDNAVEVLTGIWDRQEELGLAHILLPKLQDSKEAELRVVAHASAVMALFPEEVQRKADQQAREPTQKPPRF